MKIQTAIAAVAALMMSVGPAFATPELDERSDNCADNRNLAGSGCIQRGRYSCSANGRAVVSSPIVCSQWKFPLLVGPAILRCIPSDAPILKDLRFLKEKANSLVWFGSFNAVEKGLIGECKTLANEASARTAGADKLGSCGKGLLDERYGGSCGLFSSRMSFLAACLSYPCDPKLLRAKEIRG
ncbi:hypothetical protein GJ744_001418 [Endocarpon pusillum]|uniref:Uncharacterized protein n=1 Tax=Endocarpon pusillum TaxID=364733 RepID=A0A8H7ANQ0_9EURO|nr:hypothetical protein GJ744_001418 [Endocarpon pusillum]